MRDKILYQSLDRLRADILWDSCANDAAELLALVSEVRQTLRSA
jgi:hypothetical protein